MAEGVLMNSRWTGFAFLVLATAMTAGIPVRPSESEGEERDEWQHFSERCASDSLQTLTVAEAEFRANDRDWCTVNDFWSTDVSGLYPIAPAWRSVPLECWDGIGTWHGNLWIIYRMCAWSNTAPRNPVKRIELSIVSADK
jgi:hypothetical protein